jgi:amino acid transporter
MVPVTRIVTLVMSGVICFALLVPLAVERHNALLAIVIVAIFALYLGANVLLWLRLRPRA